ncbi:MAG: hypothetical protein JJE36_02410 [Coriobacteriia bacterium]|nr:hypothetical protein [Coriobacteriia bacterium]
MDSDADFIENMMDIINPYIDEDTGASGDGAYGSYVEWPSLDTLDETVLEELLDYFEIDLPFGKDIGFTEAVRMVARSGVIDSHIEVFFEKAAIVNDRSCRDDVSSIKLRIPELPEIKEEVVGFLREKGVPEGTFYENGGEMNNYPERTRCWGGADDEDYRLYREFGLEYEKYIAEISDIESKVDSLDDVDIAKKALILSAFILTESFVKSKIVNKIPDKDTNILNLHFRRIIDKHINANLKNADGRKGLFKEFCEGKLGKIPNVGLRNVLAHDIAIPEIRGGQIVFQIKGSDRDLDICAVFSELKDFAKKLEDAMSL